MPDIHIEPGVKLKNYLNHEQQNSFQDFQT